MNFDWLKYLAVAEKLLEPVNSMLGEAAYRSSASRAYYAIFGATLITLKTRRSVSFRLPEKHKKLIDWLKEQGEREPELASFGTQLDRLRKERIDADYGEDLNYRRIRAEKSLRMAKNLRDRLSFL